MSIGVRPGDPLILTLMLGDGASNKYIRAYCFTDSNVPIAGSPFILYYSGNGVYYYKSSTLVFPVGVSQVRAEYYVYEDALFTVKSNYENSMDIFYLSPVLATSEISTYDQLNAIKVAEITNGKMQAISINLDKNG